MIAQEEINAVVGKIVESIQPIKIILFGSYAYGQPNEDSDLDLLIVKNTDKPLNKRTMEVRRCLRGIKIPMDIMVYTEDEIEEWKDTKGAFINQVIKMGKVL